MREFAPLIEGDSRSSIAARLADALGVHPPRRPARVGKGAFDALGSLAHRAMTFSHSETLLLTEAREFAADFEEAWLFEAVATAQKNRDRSTLVHPVKLAVNEVRKQIAAVVHAPPKPRRRDCRLLKNSMMPRINSNVSLVSGTQR